MSVMVCELVAEVMWATTCETAAVMVTAMVTVMVSGTKTQMLVSMHGCAPGAGRVGAGICVMSIVA